MTKRALDRFVDEMLAEGTAQSSYRSLYYDCASTVHHDCFSLDSLWLIDNYPRLWNRMVVLDDELNQMERGLVAESLYRNTLARLVSIVTEARALYVCEQGQEFQ